MYYLLQSTSLSLAWKIAHLPSKSHENTREKVYSYRNPKANILPWSHLENPIKNFDSKYYRKSFFISRSLADTTDIKIRNMGIIFGQERHDMTRHIFPHV